MKKKIRLTRTMTIEYEPNPSHYPDGLTIEQMAQLDANQECRDDIFDDDLSSDIVEWEIIEEAVDDNEG